MKATIYQHFPKGNNLEVYFTYNGIKFTIQGTEINEDNHCFHTIRNESNKEIKSVPHSVLERYVDFVNKPVLLK